MPAKKSGSAVENREATQKASLAAPANPADFGKSEAPVRDRIARNIKKAQHGKPVLKDRAR